MEPTEEGKVLETVPYTDACSLFRGNPPLKTPGSINACTALYNVLLFAYGTVSEKGPNRLWSAAHRVIAMREQTQKEEKE